jgi:multidrug efflux pump subunit AcrA (membrane-fusion protein)
MPLFQGRVLIIILCAVTLLISVGCGTGGRERGNRANANAANSESQPAITITVGKSELRDVPSTIQATGSLVANETSDVAPKVAGKISNIGANVGEFVSAGSMLAKIDDRDARLRLAQAQAGVKQAQAAVRQAEARLGLLGGGKFEASTVPEVREANANYQQALAEQKQAEANEARYRELIESGDVSMMQYETFRTARDTARAKSKAAKDQLDATVNTARQSNQAIITAQANVEAAATQVAEAQQAIKDTVIYAPFAGYVSARPVAVGEYVSSASIIATILRTNPIKAQIQVAEADVPAVVVGRGVSVEVDAYKDRKFGGTVSAVNPGVDPNSRSAVIEALIDNSGNALRAGMFVTANIVREGGSKAVFVPKAAVYNDQPTQSYRVYVIQDGIAKLKVVQLGTEEGDSYQIISGVDADQTVATSALDQLFEGARVVF